MEFRMNSTIKLKPLNIYEDKKNYIVEELGTDNYFEMPKICIDAIELMNKGYNLDDVQNILMNHYPNENIDILDFVNQLYTFGLIIEIDGIEVKNQRKDNLQHNQFWWIPSFVGKLFFNQKSIIFYLVLFVINIGFFVKFPKLFPNYKDIFLFQSMTFNILTWSILSLIILLIHEFGHILAIRSKDLPVTLEIGHRLFFIVFETDMSHVWKLPPRERNILYLAGLCFDQVSLFAALSLQLILPEEWALFKGMLGVMVFDIVIKMLYQCCFYMKTDLYYVFENVTGCYNLMENAQWWLKKRLPFLRAEGKGDVFAGEERIIRYYSLFYAAGVFITLAIFIFYILPQTIHSYMRSLANLSNPVNSPYFWDGVTFLVLSTLMIGLLLYSMAKKYRYRT
jgi:putative peptide zinc metalloprotease protein